jgi:hypothetical protein
MLRRDYCQSLLFVNGCTAKTRKFMRDDMIVSTVLSTVLYCWHRKNDMMLLYSRLQNDVNDGTNTIVIKTKLVQRQVQKQ